MKLHYKNFLFLFLIVLICSCKKVQQKTNSNYQKNEVEARFVDVPIPLNIKPLDFAISEKSYGFQTNLAEKEIIKFYLNEMEYWGWKLNYNFSGIEKLLIFEKPNKVASISLRQNNKYIDVVIQINIKN